MEQNPLSQSEVGQKCAQKLEGSVYNPRKLELETKATRSLQPFRDCIAPSTLTTWTYTLAPRPTAFVLKIIPPGHNLAHFFPSQGTSLRFQMASLVSIGKPLPISGDLESPPGEQQV